MNYDEITKKLTTGDIPAGVMAAGGVLVLLLALKAAKGLFKLIFILVALGLLGGAVWWHFHYQH